MTCVVSAASLTLLRRDMSLNRRLYAWMLGTKRKLSDNYRIAQKYSSLIDKCHLFYEIVIFIKERHFYGSFMAICLLFIVWKLKKILMRKVKRTGLKQHGWVYFYMCVLSGLDIKGGMVAADSSRFNTVEEYTAFYFSTHSRELLVQVLKITHSLKLYKILCMHS